MTAAGFFVLAAATGIPARHGATGAGSPAGAAARLTAVLDPPPYPWSTPPQEPASPPPYPWGSPAPR
ncbi:MAG TPA: NYN domain-containing protein, partial [Streptosporangiaceae bacterium]|nr:NYN domain-containing protein [Streptosporangiaceae bacterium]